MKTLYIGRQFSDDPAGRYYTDGDGNGEEFREEVLRILLSYGKPIKINIDENVAGYGSSFLVEAFGGLVKHGYFTKDIVLRMLSFEYNDPDFQFYEKKIIQYINEAEYNSMVYNSSKEIAIREGKFFESINKSFLAGFK